MHPNSEYLKEAKFLKTRSLVETKKINEGLLLLNDIDKSTKNDSILTEQIYSEIDFFNGDYNAGLKRIIKAFNFIIPEISEDDYLNTEIIYSNFKYKIEEFGKYEKYFLFEDVLSLIRNTTVKKDIYENLVYLSLIQGNDSSVTKLISNIDDGDFLKNENELRLNLITGLDMAFADEYSFEGTEEKYKSLNEKNIYLPILTFYKAIYYTQKEIDIDSAKIYISKSLSIKNKLINTYIQSLNQFYTKYYNLIKSKYISAEDDSLKIIDNDFYFKAGELFYEENISDSSIVYFNKYIENSVDSSKIALSYLYLSNMYEVSDSLKSDSILHYIYNNFPLYKNNLDLKEKIGITLGNNTLENPIFDSVDISSTTYNKFLTLKSQYASDSTLQLNIKEKIDFMEILILINTADYQKAIPKIETFKSNFANSIFLNQINQYDLIVKKEEIVKANENDNKLTDSIKVRKLSDNIRDDNVESNQSEIVESETDDVKNLFRIPPKNVYPGKELTLKLSVKVDNQGNIIDYFTEEVLEVNLKEKLKSILAEIKYKKSPVNINRTLFINLKFGSINSQLDKENGVDKLD